ncbi:atlastin-2-like [Chironomus tepperi]|uniref:atlastin-2-like n=1 Tax=Chironomus tepperi TaxID=113505 RepID=UPI00391F96C6
MSHSHQFGSPKSVLSFSDTKEVIVNYEELDRIFSHPEIQDRKVVILSVIGAFRGGKSFFLDYCLRFLYAHFPSISNPWKPNFIFEKNPNWMGDSNEPLTGFSWQAGSNRDTIGIVFWSDVFLHTIDRNGEKLAIFVMDTQGLYDNDSSTSDNNRIFGIGTLISSIQIFNVMARIQEDQLLNFQLATELTKFYGASKHPFTGCPFQNLLFLIRDWTDEDYAYGIEGGKEYFDKIFMKTVSKNEELRKVRESIKNCFERIECCLLPHPGKTVAGKKSYNGRISDMDEEFHDEIRNIIEYILLPDNMIRKKMNSQELTSMEMKKFIFDYFKLYQSEDIPITPTIFEQTVKNKMEILIEECVEDYKLAVYRNKDLVKDQTFETIHKMCKARALKLYDDTKKLGFDKHIEFYRAELEQNIEKVSKEFARYIPNQFEVCDEYIAELDVKLQNFINRPNDLKKSLEKVENEKRNFIPNDESNLSKSNTSEIFSQRFIAENKRIDDAKKAKDKEKSFRERLKRAIRRLCILI